MRIYKYTTCLCPQILLAHYSTQRKSGKVYESALDAVADIKDGAKLLVGGFGLCGIPENLIAALIKHEATNFTVVSNNAGKNATNISAHLKISPNSCDYVKITT